ncbi:MAG: sulfatase [Pirellulaceae bacterium]
MNTSTAIRYVLLGFTFVWFNSIAASNEGKPNIVIMIADDCTFRDLGCYGGQASTPNIDRLASEGMRFTRCFQAAPMCSPTRHSLYTGQYPVKTGAYPNHTRVNEGTKSIVQYLRPLGYAVAQSGKQHVGPKTIFDWEHLPGNSNPDFSAVDRFVGECEMMDQAFCLILCSNEPHAPWNRGDASRYPPERVVLPDNFVDTPLTRDGMSRYLAEITYFDSQVGQAISILNKHRVTDRTLFILLSEQGSSFPFAKWTCYDSGLQSACIARWPGNIQPAQVNPAMIEYVDILPTLIEVAGGTVPKELDGKSLSKVLQGNQEHKAFVYGEMTTRGINNGSDYFGIRSVRSERFKYIWNFTPAMTFQNACTQSPEFLSWIARAESGDAHAISLVSRYTNRPGVELYDIETDPLEMNNLADDPKFQKVKYDLRIEMERWMKACGDRGQETELEAFEHMPRKRKSNRQRRR